VIVAIVRPPLRCLIRDTRLPQHCSTEPPARRGANAIPGNGSWRPERRLSQARLLKVLVEHGFLRRRHVAAEASGLEIGGSARSYQELFVPFAVSTAVAGHAVSPYIYAASRLARTSGPAAKWAQLCRRASYPGDGLAVVPEVAFLHDKPVGPETEQRRPGPILAAVGVIPWVSWPG
jgi:hypothetical protein